MRGCASGCFSICVALMMIPIALLLGVVSIVLLWAVFSWFAIPIVIILIIIIGGKLMSND